MPLYRYTARASTGQRVQGTEDAPSEAMALGALQNRGFIVTKIVLSDISSMVQHEAKRRHRRIKSDDLIFFLNETVMLLEAGVPLLRSLEMVSLLTESEKLSGILKTIVSNIRSGATFKDSVARHPADFPHFWSYLIEAGETSGSLPLVLKELAKNLESSNRLKKKIVSALIYPCILIIASLGVLALFMLKIIPVFEKIFSQFDSKLPPLTQVIMALSVVFRQYSLGLIAGLVITIFLLRKYSKTATGRQTINHFLLKMPVLGGTISDFIHARIGIILSTLIKSGLNLLQSLEITARAAGNSLFEDALNDVAFKVRQGKTLGTAIGEESLFSPMMVQLIVIGEESGDLPKMIAKAAQYYEERVDTFSTRVGVVIEPAILIVVGCLIGVLALSLYLPMFSMGNAIR